MKTTVFLDGAAIRDASGVFAAFAAKGLYPADGAQNLDALYDRLSETRPSAAVITANEEALKEALGDRFDALIAVLSRLREEGGGRFDLTRPFEEKLPFSTDSLASLLAASPLPVTALANAAAYLFHTLEGVSWAGFYEKRGAKLVLSAFQGKPACTSIPTGKGVCGTAAKKRATLVVSDVREFSGHIACDSASRSEIVIPLFRGRALWGVMDLDSPRLGRFTDSDRALLEAAAREIEKYL